MSESDAGTREGEAVTLSEAASACGGTLEGGEPGQLVTGVAPVDRAGERHLALLASADYLARAEASGAGAFLVQRDLLDRAPAGRPRIVVDDAHAALIPLLEAFFPTRRAAPRVHPTAVLAPGVRLGEAVSIGPYAVIDERAVLGDRVSVGPHAVVGREVEVGDDTVLHAHAVLYEGTRVGARVVVHAGARLGVDGFGYAWVDGGHRKVPQVGRCIIEDDVEIGANTTIDRGSLGDTVVGRGTKLDNLVHLAHNVRLGPHCAAAALVGIAGSARAGAGVLFAGHAGIVGHLEIGDGARIGAAARVWSDVPAGETYLGDPARPQREYLRSRAHVARLPKLTERVKALEAVVERLSAAQAGSDAADVPGSGPEAP